MHSLIRIFVCYLIFVFAIVAVVGDSKVKMRRLCSPQDIVQAEYKEAPSLNAYRSFNRNESDIYDIYGTSSIFKDKAYNPVHFCNYSSLFVKI